MLTVACYMIQHGQYSDGGLVWIEQTLRDYLEKGVPVSQIRQQASKQVGQDTRHWKVKRSPDEPPQAKIPWSMTIVDVAQRNSHAPGPEIFQCLFQGSPGKLHIVPSNFMAGHPQRGTQLRQTQRKHRGISIDPIE